MELTTYNIYGNNTDHVKLPEVCKLKNDLEELNNVEYDTFDYYYKWLKILCKDENYYYECEVDNEFIYNIKNIFFYKNDVKEKYNVLIDFLNTKENIFVNYDELNKINYIIDIKEKNNPLITHYIKENEFNLTNKDFNNLIEKNIKNNKYLYSYILYKSRNLDFNIIINNIANNIIYENQNILNEKMLSNKINDLLNEIFSYNIIIDNYIVNEEIDSKYLFDNDFKIQNLFQNYIKINNKIFRKIEPSNFNFIKTNDNIILYCNEIIINNIIKDFNIIKNNMNNLLVKLNKSFNIIYSIDEKYLCGLSSYDDYVNKVGNTIDENYLVKTSNTKINVKKCTLDNIYDELKTLPLLETNLETPNDFLINLLSDYNNYIESKKPIVTDTNTINESINFLVDYSVKNNSSDSSNNSSNNQNNNQTSNTSNKELLDNINTINNLDLFFENPQDNFVAPQINSKTIQVEDSLENSIELFDSVFNQSDLYKIIKQGFNKNDETTLTELCDILQNIQNIQIGVNPLLDNIISILNIKIKDLLKFNDKIKDFNNSCILKNILSSIDLFIQTIESENLMDGLSSNNSLEDLALTIFDNIFTIDEINNILNNNINDVKNFITNIIILFSLPEDLYDYIKDKLSKDITCLDDLDKNKISEQIKKDILNNVIDLIKTDEKSCKNINTLKDFDLSTITNLLDINEIKC